MMTFLYSRKGFFFFFTKGTGITDSVTGENMLLLYTLYKNKLYKN